MTNAEPVLRCHLTRPGDCCVFCSHGDVPGTPVQQSRRCGGGD